MDAFQTRFSQKLRDALENSIVAKREALSDTLAPDHSGYCQRAGHIAGLKEALRTMVETEAEMGRTDDKPQTANVLTRQGYET